MFLVIEENPNCGPEERLFSTSGEKRPFSQVRVDSPSGKEVWCEVKSVKEGGKFEEAHAIQVEDSGAGSAWLVHGGPWGIRFRPEAEKEDWSLESKSQWGEPFKVLDISGVDIQF